MSELRTALQIKANRLDLEIYQTGLMVHRFAEVHTSKAERDRIEQAARDILAARSHIRKHMHRKDREATS